MQDACEGEPPVDDRQSILIVEDDDLWQTVLREPLEDEGYDTTITSGYEDGRQALEAYAFDLIILDLELDASEPILSGERLLAHISQCYPGTPCIVVSGRGNVRVIRDAFKQYHVVDYIAKDRFDIPTFLDVAKVALKSTVAPAALRRTLEEKFDLEEIQDLCFDLDIDFAALRGDEKKVREIVGYCRRQGCLGELVARIAELRPGLL
jgi:DNA-binding NtrC family response regulator